MNRAPWRSTLSPAAPITYASSDWRRSAPPYDSGSGLRAGADATMNATSITANAPAGGHLIPGQFYRSATACLPSSICSRTTQPTRLPASRSQATSTSRSALDQGRVRRRHPVEFGRPVGRMRLASDDTGALALQLSRTGTVTFELSRRSDALRPRYQKDPRWSLRRSRPPCRRRRITLGFDVAFSAIDQARIDLVVYMTSSRQSTGCAGSQTRRRQSLQGRRRIAGAGAGRQQQHLPAIATFKSRSRSDYLGLIQYRRPHRRGTADQRDKVTRCSPLLLRPQPAPPGRDPGALPADLDLIAHRYDYVRGRAGRRLPRTDTRWQGEFRHSAARARPSPSDRRTARFRRCRQRRPPARLGIIATRQAFPVEPGRAYAARFAYQRRANPSDPSNDSVAASWCGSTRRATALYSDRRERRSGPHHRSGRQEVGVSFARSAGAGLLVAPAAACYVRLRSNASARTG